MALTYEPIATTTLGSASNSITFNSIPNTYTDLRVIFVIKSANSIVNARLRLNGDSGGNYSWTFLAGNGSSASSGFAAGGQISINLSSDIAQTNETLPSFYSIDIFSYTGSTFKTTLTSASADYNGSGGITHVVGMWRSTTAVNSLTLLGQNSANFDIGTTATLYGIKAA